MSRAVFREGGDLNVTRTGPEEYRMSVTIPKDEDGRVARECHAPDCSPAYFKVKPGTGIVDGHTTAYCPYCRHEDEPNKFFSAEQLRYAKDLAVREAHDGINAMIRDALGLGGSGKRKFGGGLISFEMSLKESPKPQVRRPFDEEVRRDVICPCCGLDQSVYGLATWCADCGQDIFITHVEAELSAIRAVLLDVDRRRENLGVRVAAKDIENCLEDAVSVFESVLKTLAKRHLLKAGAGSNDIDTFYKKIGNAFQNLDRSAEIFARDFGVQLGDAMTPSELATLNETFNKRHPITHNLGIADRKYLDRTRVGDKEGREVLVPVEEVEGALLSSMKIFGVVHAALQSNRT